MEYYINGKKVAHDTAKILFTTCCTRRGIDFIESGKTWNNRYSEEGREIIFDLSNWQIEIIAE